MGGPALRCAAGKSNRARCFQRVALSTAPFFFLERCASFCDERCASQGASEATSRVAPEAIGKPLPSAERFLVARWSRHRSRAATSNGASVRKPGRRTPSARAYRVTRTAPSRATFARQCRRSCRRRRPATPRPTSTVAARARSTSSPAEASWRARPLPLRAWGALPTWGSMIGHIKTKVCLMVTLW